MSEQSGNTSSDRPFSEYLAELPMLTSDFVLMVLQALFWYCNWIFLQSMIIWHVWNVLLMPSLHLPVLTPGAAFGFVLIKTLFLSPISIPKSGRDIPKKEARNLIAQMRRNTLINYLVFSALILLVKQFI